MPNRTLKSPMHVKKCPSCGSEGHEFCGVQWMPERAGEKQLAARFSPIVQKRQQPSGKTEWGANLYNCLACHTTFMDLPQK